LRIVLVAASAVSENTTDSKSAVMSQKLLILYQRCLGHSRFMFILEYFRECETKSEKKLRLCIGRPFRADV
jgi:hypothetical protein